MSRLGRGSTWVGSTGAHSTFGTMRNTAAQREREGKPIPFGERPEGRPMAHELGNGRSFAGSDCRPDKAKGREVERGDGYATLGMARPKDPAHFRKAAGLKPYSWEVDNADS